MGLLSTLFGSGKVIEKGTDMLDHAFYTNQEKAEGHIRFLKAYEPFKLTQRLLALSIVPLWSLCYFVCFVIWLVKPEYDLSAAMAILDGRIGMAALLILGFYFAGGAINSLKK